MTIDLKDPSSAKMFAGRFAMALFATADERKIEAGAEDGAKIEQAEQVAAALGITSEEALPKIGIEKLPDSVEPFMKIKKRFLPENFMAQENEDALSIQAAARIVHSLRGDLPADAAMTPKVFADTPPAVKAIQEEFKGVLERRLSLAPDVAADAAAFDHARAVLSGMAAKYSAIPGRKAAAASLTVFAGYASAPPYKTANGAKPAVPGQP